jgi:tetratricopeptide (TPR) repeat protein
MPPAIYLSALFLGLLYPVSGPAVARVATKTPATPATSAQTARLTFAQLAKQADEARTAERIPDAIRLYRYGVRANPAWADGWWYLGTLLYDQDRFDEAQTAFTHFVAVAKDPTPAYGLLALCEYETRNYDAALTHLQKWAAKGSPGGEQLRGVANFHFALLFTRSGQFADALYLLTSTAQKQGPNPALAEAMGLASLRMKNLPENYPPESRERVWLAGQSVLYSSVQDTVRAAEFADKLLLHYGSEPNVHFLRGMLFSLDKQRSATVAQEFEQELRISPQHVPAMIALASLYMEQPDRAEDAVALAKRATDADPKSALAHDALGRTLFAAGRLQEGANELAAAKTLAPDLAPVRLHLSEVYSKLGRIREAAQERAAFQALTRPATSRPASVKPQAAPARKGGRR